MSDITWPAETMAKFMDITPRRLQQLTADGVCPRAEGPKGRYKPRETNVAYIRYCRDRNPAAKEVNTSSIVQLREMQKAEIALNMEIRRRGRIPVDDIEDIVGRYFDEIAGLVKARKGRYVTDETIEDIYSSCRDVMRMIADKIKEDVGSA